MLFLVIAFGVKAGKQPANIDEAILYFEKKWSDKEKETFKSLPEKDAVNDHDLSTGIFIRSKWLSNKKDTALLHQLRSLGVDHFHDMSRVILTSLHRKLTNSPIDLDEQVSEIKAVWEPIRACEAAADKIAEENFKKFNIGDSITIYLDVDEKFGTRNTILHPCLNTEWSFDYKNDLMIKGIVTGKISANTKTLLSLKVKIAYLNFDNTSIFFKKAKVGDEMDFGLRYLLVKGRK